MSISRNIKCKSCGHDGYVEAVDTQNISKDKIFKHLGKDQDGYLHFKCPACNSESAYSPYGFFKGCLIVLFIIIGVVIYLFLR